jgi:hypothetical protein
MLKEQVSPISESVTEIQINSHLARENNLTTRVVTFRNDYQRVELGPTSP